MHDEFNAQQVPADQPDGFTYDVAVGERRVSSGGFLLDAVRRRKAGSALVSGLVTVLFLAGVGMFTYPFFTDVYTEQVLQRRLEDEFVEVTSQIDTMEEWEAHISGGEQGSPLTKLAIPTLGVETLVVEGTSPAALRAGAGHYPNTPLPGQAGNVAIAGHRTTYGKPFNRIDELRVGQEIWLSTPVGDYRYVVTSPPSDWTVGEHTDTAAYITLPKDWQVIDRRPGRTLTLTSCHPKGSAARRVVIHAVLDDSQEFAPGTYERMVDAGEITFS